MFLLVVCGPHSKIRVYMYIHIPIVSIVVRFGGYLIGSYLYIWLNQKKGTTMETIGIYIYVYVFTHIWTM